MELNADFSRRAVVHAAAAPWVASPAPGVERRLLDRIGDEVARATSVVRYAAGSRFPAHDHEAGEEFMVLEGVFQDERGDYPAGTYVRNPPGSRHAPASAGGCTIFVKLRQFAPDDLEAACIDTTARAFAPVPGRPGIESMALFGRAGEAVAIERWAPGMPVTAPAADGLELLVLEGGFVDEGADGPRSDGHAEAFGRHDWLRLPRGSMLQARAGTSGCRVWVKRGGTFPAPRGGR